MVVLLRSEVIVGTEIWQMSIGTERRWHAKIVFIIGIYW